MSSAGSPGLQIFITENDGYMQQKTVDLTMQRPEHIHIASLCSLHVCLGRNMNFNSDNINRQIQQTLLFTAQIHNMCYILLLPVLAPTQHWNKKREPYVICSTY